MSADGTAIQYFTIGSGAPVIVIPGALATADDYFNFARALGKHFTVHVVERRGRGGSGPQGPTYNMERECEDLLAVHAKTKASRVVGHSFGGLVALETARRHAIFDCIAVYEPGVSIKGSIPMRWMSRYQRFLSEGKRLDAFAAFSVGTGPDRGRKTPIWLMRLLLSRLVPVARRTKMLALLEQNAREHREVQRCDDHVGLYSKIQASVLIMKGGRSGIGWVDLASAELAAVLPDSEVVEFAKLDHFGIAEKAPEEVAAATAQFFQTRQVHTR